MKKSIVCLMLAVFVLAGCSKEIDVKVELEKALGDNSSWEIAYFPSELSDDMSCEEVKVIVNAAYSSESECGEPEGHRRLYSYLNVLISDHPIIGGITFNFFGDLLSSGDLKFRNEDVGEDFKAISLEVFEAKWGAVSGDRDRDSLSRVVSGQGRANRTGMLEGWDWSIGSDF